MLKLNGHAMMTDSVVHHAIPHAAHHVKQMKTAVDHAITIMATQAMDHAARQLL